MIFEDAKSNGVFLLQIIPMRRYIFLLFSISFFFLSCSVTHPTTTASNFSASIDGHPAWIEQGNIYEVNTRQYTPQGTFKAFEVSLPSLKDMGVQTLWFLT